MNTKVLRIFNNLPVLPGIFLLLLSFLISPQLIAHEYYVSVTTLTYNGETETIEITFKLFTDDIERKLEEHKEVRLKLGADTEYNEANSLIDQYLKKRFKLSINKKDVDLVWLGKEVEMDITWCYYEIKNIKSFESIQIENKILIDYKDEQVNLVHLELTSASKSLTFNRSKTKLGITY